MSWFSFELAIDRDALSAASAKLFALGATGLEEADLPDHPRALRQPWDVGPLPPEPTRILVRAWFEGPDREAVAATMGPDGTWTAVPAVDWEAEARSGFAPIRISDRLVVAPPWDAPAGALIIEPGQGFGTGDHPTTRACLEAIDALADTVDTALDVGCGSGVLALALARFGVSARGVDVDPNAVANARANAARNGLQVRFDTTPLHRIADEADLVVANLHAELIVTLGPELCRVAGRWLVLGGILASREGVVRAALDGALDLVDRRVDGDWISLRYRAP